MKSRKKNAMIVGDTRKFHLGSLINCNNLAETITKKYNFIGFEGGKDFKFYSYQDFIKRIKRSRLLKKIQVSDAVFCNGEGFIEPSSPYGKSLFYLAKFIKTNFENKKVFLVNFSCFDPYYGNWLLFDKVVPRDYGSYVALNNKVKKIKLGFDCSILEKLPKKYFNSDIITSNKKIVLLFRGRKQITKNQLITLKSHFDDSDIIPVSGFWKFKDNIPSKLISSKNQLYKLLSESWLVVSSSFHGIVFSALFSKPFIPLSTYPIPKNESIASDILGKYFKNRDLEEWIGFYKNKKNYSDVKKHLSDNLSKFRKRALNYVI